VYDAYRLNISPGKGDEFKFVWATQFEELWPYFVSGTRVNDASAHVRDVLNAVTAAHVDSEILTSTPDFSPFLPDLARAGEDLCAALFGAISGDSHVASIMLNRIERMHGRRPLTIFYSEAPLHVPWGFVFRGDPAQIKSTGTINDFDGFWTNTFSILISFNKASLLDMGPSANRSPAVLHALHDDQFRRGAAALDAKSRAGLEQILALKVGKANDWQTCRELWRQAQNTDSIIHIYGHSDGKNIFLGDDHPKFRLDANGFSTSFKKRSDNTSNTICLINGCRTGAGVLGAGFLGVTAAQGFQGFIGTEAEVPNSFALKYSSEFIQQLCIECRTVQDAFEMLRTKEGLFPLSLLYSCYAQPQFRFERPVERLEAHAQA
jgi:hypothetical protein